MDMLDLVKQLSIMLHLFGVVIGAGGAFAADWIFYSSICDFTLTKDECRLIKRMSVLIWVGLFIILISGIGIFVTNIPVYLVSQKFWFKMSIVAIIAINGYFMHKKYFPFMTAHTGRSIKKNIDVHAHAQTMMIHGAISAVSWVSAIILGSLRQLPAPLFVCILLYVVAIISTSVIFISMKKRFFCRVPHKKRKI